jgi:hypothetical protein
MKSITWDIAILAVGGIFLAYCLLIRKQKSLAALVSVYLAYLVTLSWGDWIAGLFFGERVLLNSVWIKSRAAPYMIEIGLYFLLVTLLTLFMKQGGRRSRYALGETVLYCVLATAFATMAVVSLLPAEVRTTVIAGSKLVPYVYNYREWAVLAPVLVMVFFGITRDEE